MASVLKVDTVLESTSGAGTNFGGVGSASVPTLSIGSQTNKGFYDAGTNKIGVSVGGSKVGEIGVGYGGFTGNIIQVTSGELTTGVTTTLTSFSDTGLSAIITPKYSTSKILILFNCGAASSNSAVGNFFNLVRGSTNIAQGTGGSGSNQSGGIYLNDPNLYAPISICFNDSPATISPITYKIQFRSTGSGTTVAMNRQSSGTSVGAYSSLVLMEIQQ